MDLLNHPTVAWLVKWWMAIMLAIAGLLCTIGILACVGGTLLEAGCTVWQKWRAYRARRHERRELADQKLLAKVKRRLLRRQQRRAKRFEQALDTQQIQRENRGNDGSIQSTAER